jgi:tetratricopeptide (TPR) repeat protein
MQSRLKNDLHANHSHGTDEMSCTDCSGEFAIKLANYLGKKGRRFEKAKDINEAIICYEKALADYGSESELGTANLLSYANVLREEANGGEGPHDIDKAILLATTAKSLAEQNSDAILPEICSDLAEMYDARSEKSDSLNDLILAASFAKQAVDGTLPDAADFVVRSWTYANCLCALFERSGDRHYINKAINALDEAEEASDSFIDVVVRAGFRTSFAKALELRYMDTHNLTDLKYAIENAKTAVKYAEETEDTNIIAAFLGNLAMLLGEYSSVTEKMEDLYQAISAGRQALEAQESHQVLCLHNLAMMLAC